MDGRVPVCRHIPRAHRRRDMGEDKDKSQIEREAHSMVNHFLRASYVIVLCFCRVRLQSAGSVKCGSTTRCTTESISSSAYLSIVVLLRPDYTEL